ncbi:unnamed protein product [Vitrella brassicaformis CCMP3155]|uniref:Transmembrane protein n=2 Tax=Vitrella brassicaformis TaxID=1169539 RepID=A0A0G4GTR7_VITBC|nr:unnamed protein product [Vitrella brassicaformis CCMP3155]|eukprot:CEM34143.1 unnamed protein product [Vitrella brassicaformis CCMP3155]
MLFRSLVLCVSLVWLFLGPTPASATRRSLIDVERAQQALHQSLTNSDTAEDAAASPGTSFTVDASDQATAMMQEGAQAQQESEIAWPDLVEANPDSDEPDGPPRTEGSNPSPLDGQTALTEQSTSLRDTSQHKHQLSLAQVTKRIEEKLKKACEKELQQYFKAHPQHASDRKAELEHLSELLDEMNMPDDFPVRDTLAKMVESGRRTSRLARSAPRCPSSS